VDRLLVVHSLDLARYTPEVGGDDPYSYRFSARGKQLLGDFE
jgi:hypothetical protein